MSKKFDLSFDVSALGEFKNENTGLVQEMMFLPTTVASGIEVIVGEKGTIKLNNLSHDIALQAAACGWNVAGSTTFAQEEVVVETLDLKEALCPKDLTSKWMSQVMRAGSNPEELPFESFIVEGKTVKLAGEIEKMIWQGDKTTGTGNLALVDGLATVAVVGGYVADAVGPITKANAIDKVDALINAFDETILDQDDLAIYMSPSDYRTYISALIASQNPVDNQDQTKPYGKSIMVPGYNVEVIMTNGLSGVDYMYGTSKKNLVLVTDLTSDAENIEVWYSQDNDEYRLKTTFKMGVGSYFPSLIVHNNDTIV